MTRSDPADSLAVHQFLDVSVLFDTPARAKSAWTEIFKTSEASRELSFPNLKGLALLSDLPMPAGRIDRRLVGEAFDLGSSYVGMRLGLTNQYDFRRFVVANQYPDPWEQDGRLRIASLLLGDLLALGGHAVVLHKAGVVVKSASQFRFELGDLRNASVRPWLAWLDLLVARSSGGIEARSYGMPHYYGAPNFRAVAPTDDQFSLRRALQAVEYACGRVVAAGDEPASVRGFAVPLWFVPEPHAPAAAENSECLAWTATLDEQEILVTLQSDGVGSRHPTRLWRAESQEGLSFQIYARAIADQLAYRLHAQGLSLVPFSPQFEFGSEGAPTVRVLKYQGAGLSFCSTAGFGRVRATAGTDEAMTAHAEFCLYGPPGETLHRQLQGSLLAVGSVAQSTPLFGGLKDWDGLPPGPNGWGTLVVPMEDLLLSQERPIALRLVVPVTRDEAAAFRAGRSREEWYRATLPSPEAVAARWAKVHGV